MQDASQNFPIVEVPLPSLIHTFIYLFFFNFNSIKSYNICLVSLAPHYICEIHQHQNVALAGLFSLPFGITLQ